MKRILIALIILFCPILVYGGEILKVKVQKMSIFEEPKFYAKVVALVRYGDQLEMLNEQGDWAYVSFQGERGWMHKSGLTSAKVNLGTIFLGGSSSSTTHDEVALAGKGFTPEVENGYRNGHPEMNYALVDEIEQYTVSEDSLYEFIKKGGLQWREE